MTRLYIVTLELLSYSDNGCFPESCLMINCKIEKLLIKLVAGWSFLNVAPLKFQLTFRTILFSVIHNLPTLTLVVQRETALNQLQTVSSSWFLWNERHNVGPNCIFIANLISAEGKTPSENPSFSLKGKRRRLSIYFIEITAKVQQTISCVMLPFAGRNIGLPRQLKGPCHVLHLHNCIRGVTCSSHTNELMTRDKKKTRRFSWTWRWMFLIQS